MKKYFLTSESVSPGHPDKICDQISDAILDAILNQDSESHVACEVMVTAKKMIISGEVKTSANVNYEAIARKMLQDIGYDNDEWGVNYQTYPIEVLINHQSHELNAVSQNNVAGDQAIMFGFASDESKIDFMPLPITLAHALVKTATLLRNAGLFKWARPDMKSQVTVKYQKNKSPEIYAILMSIQHEPNINLYDFKKFVIDKIIMKVVNKYNLNTNFKMMVNPSGSFTIGGPKSDTGLTGRKIIVDTYGGSARHGGGCFSGKDGSKIDRSGAYMCRYVAKNLVASGIVKKIEIQVAYIIGQAKPISYWIKTFHTSPLSDKIIIKIIKEQFDFSIAGIIRKFNLKAPIYLPTATYGHFGNNHHNYPWEKLDMQKTLTTLLKDYQSEQKY